MRKYLALRPLPKTFDWLVKQTALFEKIKAQHLKITLESLSFETGIQKTRLQRLSTNKCECTISEWDVLTRFIANL